jgi:mRNA interferase MazF
VELKQYSIVLVNLDPTVGSEIQKTRPCVVLSPPQMNAHLNTIIVAPMTTTKKAYPTRVPVKFQEKEGFIALDQIRTIDKMRLVQVFPGLSPAKKKKVKSVLSEMLVE